MGVPAERAGGGHGARRHQGQAQRRGKSGLLRRRPNALEGLSVAFGGAGPPAAASAARRERRNRPGRGARETSRRGGACAGRGAGHDRRERLALVARLAWPPAGTPGRRGRDRQARRGCAHERPAARLEGDHSRRHHRDLVPRLSRRSRRGEPAVRGRDARRETSVHLDPQRRPGAEPLCAPDLARSEARRRTLLEWLERADLSVRLWPELHQFPVFEPADRSVVLRAR